MRLHVTPALAVIPSEMCLGKAEVWIIGNWHPALNTGYVRPGGHSSGMENLLLGYLTGRQCKEN